MGTPTAISGLPLDGSPALTDNVILNKDNGDGTFTSKRTTLTDVEALIGGGGGGGGAATPDSYDAMVLSESGLLYYWPLSDVSGGATDLAQGRVLSVTGAPTYHASSLIDAGDPAMSFADSTAHLDFDAAVGFYPQAPFTWECIIELPSLPSGNLKFLCMESGSGGVALYIQSSGLLMVEFNDVVDQSTGVTLAVGTPYHIVLGYNGAAVTVWINDVPHYLGTIGLPLATNGSGGASVIQGGPITIQKVAFYNALLPSARISAHHEAIAGTAYSYPFPASGSSGSVAITPSIVQYSAPTGNDPATVSLPAAPTPGNVVFLLVGCHPGRQPAFAQPFYNVGTYSPGNDEAVQLWAMIVQEGDTGVYGMSSWGDNGAVIAVETTPVSVLNSSVMGAAPSSGSSTNGPIPQKPFLNQGMAFALFSNEGTSAGPSGAPAGWTDLLGSGTAHGIIAMVTPFSGGAAPPMPSTTLAISGESTAAGLFYVYAP